MASPRMWAYLLLLSVFHTLALAAERQVLMVQYMSVESYHELAMHMVAYPHMTPEGVPPPFIDKLTTQLVFMPTATEGGLIVGPIQNDAGIDTGLSVVEHPKGVPLDVESTYSVGGVRRVSTIGKIDMANVQLYDNVGTSGIIPEFWTAKTSVLAPRTNDINDFLAKLMIIVLSPDRGATIEYPAEPVRAYLSFSEVKQTIMTKDFGAIVNGPLVYYDLAAGTSRVVRFEDAHFPDPALATGDVFNTLQEETIHYYGDEKLPAWDMAQAAASVNNPEAIPQSEGPLVRVNGEIDLTGTIFDDVPMTGSDTKVDLTGTIFDDPAPDVSIHGFFKGASSTDLSGTIFDENAYLDVLTAEEGPSNSFLQLMAADLDCVTSPGHKARRGVCPASSEKTQLTKVPSTTIQTRVAGRLSTVLSYGLRALALGGAAALLALPALIILDFVHGEWQAACWTIGSVAAGIVADAAVTAALAGASIAGFAVAGPIGVLVGALVGILFSIIPGLFKVKQTAKSDNTTSIIQYAFFGDPTHTGNEKCNDNLKDNNQTPNCTVSYGVNAVASMFKWDPADATFFFINYNYGYAMTIPDIASKLVVYDYTNTSAFANVPAYIDCGNKKCPLEDDSEIPWTKEKRNDPDAPTCAPTDAYTCDKPKFVLNRAAIKLPILNKTADVVFKNIQSGECKIVSDPIEGELIYAPVSSGFNSNNVSTVWFNPNGNSTAVNSTNGNSTNAGQTGMSPNNTAASNTSSTTASKGLLWRYANGTEVAIPTNYTGTNVSQAQPMQSVTSYKPLFGAWNTSQGPPVNLTGQPVYIGCNLTANIPSVLSANYSAATSNLYLSPNSSTNGETTAFIAPPAPQAFLPLNISNAVCLSSSKGNVQQLCLPNGTFTSCNTGAFGFKTSSFDNLLSTAHADVTLNIQQVSDSGGTDVTPDTSFATNDTASGTSDFGFAMKTLTDQKGTLDISVKFANTGAAMCLYSAPNFKGDVFCLGPGGTNFTSNLVNKAASITLEPNFVAWIYPNFYGNPLGTYISRSVADLSSVPYLTDSNFAKVVAAAWIYNATAPRS